MTALPALDELQARFAAACDLKQTVNRDKISAALREWAREIGAPVETRVVFVSSSGEMLTAARDATAATAARAARAARDAWAARAARDATAAWAARDARDAWDARDASFEVSWLAITAIGAVSINYDKTARIWLPLLSAFEAGAYAFLMTDAEIFVSTIPTIVKTDNERRLHCEAGPAFKWLDDIEDHYWHGAHVPAKWIVDRANVTTAEVFAEANAETRRAGCEIIGWDRVLSSIDAKLLDDDDDPQIGALYEGQIPGATKCTFLKVECGTGRQFVIPTAPGLASALEAQAWIANKPVNQWVRPEVRG